MSVIIQAHSVLVPVDLINDRYPGGLNSYETDCPNETYCTDDRIARVGFMSQEDVEYFLARLAQCGLHLGDVAVVGQVEGPIYSAAWLSIREYARGIHGAYLSVEEPGDLAAPRGWSIEGHHSFSDGWRTADECSQTMHSMGSEGGLDVYYDEKDGIIRFTGNAFE